jgi:hypothetical protein
MFLCKECLSTNHYNKHFAYSYGPCENCKVTATCVNCKCSVKIKPSKTRKKK